MTHVRKGTGNREGNREQGSYYGEVVPNPKVAYAHEQLGLADKTRRFAHGYCRRCPGTRVAYCGHARPKPSTVPPSLPPPDSCVVCLDFHEMRMRGEWSCPGCGQ